MSSPNQQPELPSSTEAVLEFCDVMKIYGAGEGEVRALAGVSFQIHPGEFVAMMGPSGSGKSTTMNILGCLDTPSRGSYRFRGVDVGALSQKQRARLRRYYLGFVFQGFNLLARTNALENVELPLIYRGTPRAERRERAREALELVGLARWWDHTPAELSGGQQQRVAIARAVVTEPSVLLADEPTGNLDRRTAGMVFDLMLELNRSVGTSLVIVTHDPDLAARTDRTLHLVDGVLS